MRWGEGEGHVGECNSFFYSTIVSSISSLTGHMQTTQTTLLRCASICASMRAILLVLISDTPWMHAYLSNYIVSGLTILTMLGHLRSKLCHIESYLSLFISIWSTVCLIKFDLFWFKFDIFYIKRLTKSQLKDWESLI